MKYEDNLKLFLASIKVPALLKYSASLKWRAIRTWNVPTFYK